MAQCRWPGMPTTATDTLSGCSNHDGVAEAVPRVLPSSLSQALFPEIHRALNVDFDEAEQADTEKDYVKQYVEAERATIQRLVKCGPPPAQHGKHNSKPETCATTLWTDTNIAGSQKSDFRKTNEDGCSIFSKYDMTKSNVDSSKLAIYSGKRKILDTLKTCQSIVVEGYTGCGKTTQVPQFLLDEAAETRSNCRIVVTQPRRIAAISVANRVCQEREWELGSLVGYQVGLDRKTGDDTLLTYMTTGVLLQILISKRSLKDFTHIIIDEVHERDLETDLLLLVIKKILVDTYDEETKLILMSATLNAKKFSSYFALWQNAPSPVISVPPEVVYPVEEHYLDDISEDYGFQSFSVDATDDPKIFDQCFELAVKLILNFDYLEFREKSKDPSKHMSSGAVLVFLPGLNEIDNFYKRLRESQSSSDNQGEYGGSKGKRWILLPLHSSITNDEQRKVFKPAPEGYRKIIIATNIAESSITVPDVKYVIDFCLTKSLNCDPSTNYTCLRLEWASKNQCVQRRGRAGRVSSGYCYRMISKRFYGLLPQEALPEMEKASLETVVLSVKNLNMGSPRSVLALAVDPPKVSGIKRAVANLKEVGALTINCSSGYDEFDGDLTSMGKVISNLPLDLRLGRLIMLGFAFDILEDTIIIAAGLSVKSPFSYPYNRRLDSYFSKLNWAKESYSDCLAMLYLYKTWCNRHQNADFKHFPTEDKWAKAFFVQLHVMREIHLMVGELKRRLQRQGICVTSPRIANEHQEVLLKVVIAGAFYPNYFVHNRLYDKEYERELQKELMLNDPLHTVVYQGFPIEQPGELYAKQIARALSQKHSVPCVDFNSSRVIVSFDPRGDKIGPISIGVYRALKMRQLRNQIMFYTLRRTEAYEALAEAKTGLEKLINSNATRCLKAPPLVQLPSIETSVILINVTHVESPGEFYFVYSADVSYFEVINERLQNAGSQLKPFPEDDIMPGNLCVIQHNGEYFRGRIENEKLGCDRIGENELLVQCIDTGRNFWKKPKEILRFNEELVARNCHTVPGLAIQGRLSEVKPLTKYAGTWESGSVALMKESLTKLSETYKFKIYSVVKSIIAGALYHDKAKESLNRILVDRNLAEYFSEPAESRSNNDARSMCKAVNYDELTVMAHNNNQVSKITPKKYLDIPALHREEVLSETRLRGPYTPIELRFLSLCGSSCLKDVKIEGSSVNCVALDHEPYFSNSHFMVAANVGIAHRSGSILARETTMMPPFQGLSAIMVLLFCPKLEMRLNPCNSKFTGLIAGLGVDPSTGRAIYPDHDVEVVFDTVFDTQDLIEINSIRLAISSVLKHSRDEDCVSFFKKEIRDSVIKMLTKPRTPMEKEWHGQSQEWLTSTSKTSNEYYHTRLEPSVFPAHNIPLLERHDPLHEQDYESNFFLNRS